MATITPASIVASPSETTRGPETARSLLSGARAMLPWLVGVVPFGLVIGVTVSESHVPAAAGWATGAIIYAGSAQLATVDLLDHGAAPIMIIITALVINARLIAYSGSIALHWRDTSYGFRAVASYLLVDPSFAVGMEGYRDTGSRRTRHAHYLGAAITLWIAWQLAILVGVTVGSGLPTWMHLEHVVPLFLVAQVVHSANNRPACYAAAVGALVALVGQSLPMHSGIIVAIAAGLVAAALTERAATSERSRP